MHTVKPQKAIDESLKQGKQNISPASDSFTPSASDNSPRTNAIKGKIKVSPLLGIWAMSKKAGNAWRLWVLARSYDPDCPGAVEADEFKTACIDAGIDPRTYGRWLDQAVSLGWLRQITRSTGVTVLLYISEDRLANCFNSNEQYYHYVVIDQETLIHGAWQSALWSAFIQTECNGNTISRATLAEKTGINRFQQVRLEKGTSIQNSVNVAETNMTADHLTGIQESGRKNTFVRKGKVVIRLPDTRRIEKKFMTARGRMSKKSEIGSSKSSTGVSHNNDAEGLGRPRSNSHAMELSNPVDLKRPKLFFDSEKNAIKALQRYGQRGIRVSEVFVRVTECNSGHETVCWKPIYRLEGKCKNV